MHKMCIITVYGHQSYKMNEGHKLFSKFDLGIYICYGFPDKELCYIQCHNI